jgi:hypothetical protein
MLLSERSPHPVQRPSKILSAIINTANELYSASAPRQRLFKPSGNYPVSLYNNLIFDKNTPR